MEFINNFFNLQSAISFLIVAVPFGIVLYKFTAWRIRKDMRLFNNLKRTIYLMSTDSTAALQREKTMLHSNGLYHVSPDIIHLSDLGHLETVNSSSIFVVGYSKDFHHYKKIIDRAKRDSIPVVVLAAGPRDITDEDMAIFKEYPYFEMCNTSSRLLTTIFSLSAVTPNDKK